MYDLADDFSMWVVFKDVYRSVISKGFLSWARNTEKKWFDRQLCSIIRGDKGFTVVHYAFFQDAFLTLVDGNTTRSRVSGKVIAYYDIRDFYLSSYQKKYYQSVILNKDAEEDLPLQSYGSSIALSKSFVAVPRFSSLTFDVDLSVSPVHEEGSNSLQEAKFLQGCITFKSRADGEYSGRISGQDVQIEISGKFVDW
ncbi:hypothetical protein RND81_12G124900 [Saponaria officinalis]|uniref:DUF6598 domain-containing protein n=1 Tax=Saponaria officinalis TaxID=3572 RepID=A0AAW1H9T0_SAPOF